MKCPYCGKEMECGMIRSMFSIFWKPGDSRLKPAAFSGDSKLLSGGSGVTSAAVKAYACKACEKIVIDYKNDGQDLNLK